MFRYRHWLWAFACVLAFGATAAAQKTGFNEREVVPQLTANDKEDVWTLHFRFQDPRIIVERVPGRGTRIVWYMVYRVYDLDQRDNPVQKTFVPDIELVTLDRHTRFADEVLPSVEKSVREREDPTGRYNILNSVRISENTIPLSTKNSFPRAVTGVAMWTEVDPPKDAKDKTPKTNKFSIFVAGLSNGYTEERPIDRPGERIIKRKTLQLDFERYGDGETIEPTGIRWTGNATWIYRQSTEPLKAAEMGAKPALKDNLGLKPFPKNPLAEPKLEPIPAIPVSRPRQ